MSSRSTRLIALGLAAPLVASLAACGSQTVDGQGSGGTGQAPTSSTPTGGGGSSSSPAPTSSSASPAVSLAARLGQGLSRATSAHLNLQIAAAGQAISGSGDEKLSNGKLLALDISESVGSALSLRLIVVGGKTYVKLPTSLNHSGKPWQLVSARSSDSTIRTLASSLASTQNSASLDSVVMFVAAARSVRQTATGTHAGLATTTYVVDVDPQKLPDSYAGKQALVGAGVTSIPVTIIIDSAGRPIKVTENLKVKDQLINVKVTIGRYNQPVHIVAPPANQVSTR